MTFKYRGYSTAHIGRWHLGESSFFSEIRGCKVNFVDACRGESATFFLRYGGRSRGVTLNCATLPVWQKHLGDYLSDHTHISLGRSGCSGFFIFISLPCTRKSRGVLNLRMTPAKQITFFRNNPFGERLEKEY